MPLVASEGILLARNGVLSFSESCCCREPEAPFNCCQAGSPKRYIEPQSLIGIERTRTMFGTSNCFFIGGGLGPDNHPCWQSCRDEEWVITGTGTAPTPCNAFFENMVYPDGAPFGQTFTPRVQIVPQTCTLAYYENHPLVCNNFTEEQVYLWSLSDGPQRLMGEYAQTVYWHYWNFDFDFQSEIVKSFSSVQPDYTPLFPGRNYRGYVRDEVKITFY